MYRCWLYSPLQPQPMSPTSSCSEHVAVSPELLPDPIAWGKLIRQLIQLWPSRT